MLRRTLGHSIQITARRWRVLHLSWIFLSVLRATANEVAWRNMSDGTWAVCNGVADIAWIALFIIMTSSAGHLHWEEPG